MILLIWNTSPKSVKKNNVFLRVGIYNNIPFFDTIEDAKKVVFGDSKNKELLNFSKVKQLQQEKINTLDNQLQPFELKEEGTYHADIPPLLKEFAENYDYISLYPNWLSGNLRLTCNSIMDSVIVLPDGTVPICQNLDVKLGNVNAATLDEIFNGEDAVAEQQFHSKNCNQCWVSYHRKYDIALYKNFEKYFGRYATSKMLGYYKWEADDSTGYPAAVR